MENDNRPVITAIVATRNRPQSIIETLYSLARQQGLGGRIYEINIIDNSTDNITSENIEAFREENEEVLKKNRIILRVIKETRAGLSYARNTGVQEASAPIIAFTDDDMIVDNYWLSAIAETFDDKDVIGVFGYTKGATEDYYISTKTETSVCDYRDTSTLWEMGHGNNMAFRREALIDIGLFDAELGAGSRYQAAEDTDLFYRMLQKGWLLRYQPAARATHYGHLHEEDTVKKIEQYDTGAAAFAAKYVAKGDFRPLKLALKRLRSRWEIIRPYIPFSPIAMLKDQHLILFGFHQQVATFVRRFVENYR
ncbi:MAG: glycosyltransferase [Candidatus Omnitrophica bacterium]|nr:glycosyltransferase [Candidatus Omnitrophota bacterium]